MRCFIGLSLPPDIRAALGDLQAELRTGRPVAEENLHLTLAFLGDTELPTLEALHGALSGIVFAPFDLRLAGLDMFGGRRPAVLFIRGDGGDALSRLHARVASATRAAGIDLRRERFRPHVTLARFRREMRAEEVARLGDFLTAHGDAALAPFTVDGFALYRSTLHPDGPVYERLADYPASA